MSSVVINETILWITGGIKNYGIRTDPDFVTSEFVLMNGSVIVGPALPFLNERMLYSHAMVNINNVLTMVIGGTYSGKKQSCEKS